MASASIPAMRNSFDTDDRYARRVGSGEHLDADCKIRVTGSCQIRPRREWHHMCIGSPRSQPSRSWQGRDVDASMEYVNK
jgi:hypothetical protein